MEFKIFKNTVLLFVLVFISCGNNNRPKVKSGKPKAENQKLKIEAPIVGANQTADYLSLLKNKNIGVVANQTSVIFKGEGNKHYTHLVDSLVSLNIKINTVFAPEHGFRGTADAGEHIKDGIDKKTGISIISLYGDNKKPKAKQLNNLDVVVFDIQDVGVRFYTYISTLHYVMEACAENNIPVLILDRPNPNGYYIDGPVLEMENKSFVGMHPIPVVHGMTIGEYAQMINGEKWLKNNVSCNLTVIPIKHYTHKTPYNLPIKPSPNLPNNTSINLYPSLCFFEGTNVNAGRGTETQFQVFGSPFLSSDVFTYQYTPKPNNGSKHPKHKNKLCFGENLTKNEPLKKLNLTWLIKAFNNTKDKNVFFNNFFIKLSGSKNLRQQIESGLSENEIRDSWQSDLNQFTKVRTKYLIYPD
ncbi:MAG: exo-beta-N-acetylmuramidase NamZ domain-containing protein [Aestuariibaculum sp.]